MFKKENGKTNWVKIGLYAVGFIIIFLIIRKLFGSTFSFQDDAELNEDAINAGLEGMSNVDVTEELSDDDSPPFYTYQSEGALTQEAADSILASYTTKVEAMAANIDVPLDEMLETVAYVLLSNMSTGDVITERAMELYLDHLNIWLPIYMNANEQVFDKTAEITAELFNANTEATTCTETVFMKDVTEEVNNTNSQTVNSIAVTSSKGGFLGMNKRKTTTEQTIIENVSTSDTTRHIQYIPHCVGWGISESNFAANIATFTLGLSAVYSFFQTVLDACPDVNAYVAISTETQNRQSR